MKRKKIVQTLIDKAINILFGICIIMLIWIVVQVFFIASFRIPSNSMEPELTNGDYVLAEKLSIGARLFNIFSSMKGNQVAIYRFPGISKIHRNDVLVFNNPSSRANPDRVKMRLFKYYIKRCLALPGDTFLINRGIYQVNSSDLIIGNIDSQRSVASFDKGILFKENYNTYPFDRDSIIKWNILNFGPLYIPKKGDSIPMDRFHYILYRKIIEWEEEEMLQYRDSIIYLNNIPINGYRFKKNYYFMGGDNCINSEDSRYWGLLPEEYIVGKAWIIWKSVNPKTNDIQWNRILKSIN